MMPQQYRLESTQVKQIEELLQNGKVVEVKIEHGKPVLISISRKIVRPKEEE